MKKYTIFASALIFCTVAITIGMETPTTTTLDNVITYLDQRPITLEKCAWCHSIKDINDNDEVTMRTGEDNIITWDMHTGKQKHTEKAPKNRAIPYKSETVISGNLIAENNHGTVNVYDLTTDKCIFTFTENDRIETLALHKNKVVTALQNRTVHIRDIDTNTLLSIQTRGMRYPIAIQNNNVIVVGADESAQMFDMNNGELLKTFINGLLPEGGPHDIQAIAANDNLVAAVIYYQAFKIWDMHTGNLLKTITGSLSLSDNPSPLLAINSHYIAMADWGQSAQVWRLLPDLNGTPENNPLLWIMHKATTSQQDLIKRAYEATITHKKLMITLPENPGITTIGESQEIKDGRLYSTLTLAVRNYLRSRLNITVY